VIWATAVPWTKPRIGAFQGREGGRPTQFRMRLRTAVGSPFERRVKGQELTVHGTSINAVSSLVSPACDSTVLPASVALLSRR
jgi:class 3 adenylate cyclase